MKQLYNGNGRRVHPNPPLPTASPPTLWGQLPAATLALAAVLTAGDQEVLAYLLSGGGGGSGLEEGRGRRKQPRRWRSAHSPQLGCGCFGCYKSYWARWDTSPNRHLIHLIIDAFEETLETQQRAALEIGHDRGRSGGRRRAGRRRGQGGDEESLDKEAEAEKGFQLMDGGHVAVDNEEDGYVGGEGVGGDEGEGEGEGGSKSSVKRLVSFIGERVWGIWNQ